MASSYRKILEREAFGSLKGSMEVKKKVFFLLKNRMEATKGIGDLAGKVWTCFSASTSTKDCKNWGLLTTNLKADLHAFA